MLSLYRTLSRRYWRLRWGRTLLVLVSIALGVSTWVATGVLNRSLEKAGGRSAAPLAGAADLYVSNGDAGVQSELKEAVAEVPGVGAVRPLVVQRVVLPDLRQPALLLGLDLTAPPAGDCTWSVQVHDVTPRMAFSAMLLHQRPVLLGRELDRMLPADETDFNVLVAGQVHRLRRTGTIDAHGQGAALAGNTIVTDWDAAAALLGRRDLVSRFDVALAPGADLDEVRSRLRAKLGERGQVSTPEGHDQRAQEMLTGVKIGLSLCSAGALVVGLFLVYNALAVSVAERRHDIGILRSLGGTRGQIGRLFLGEAALLGLAATALGIPLGVGLARLSVGPLQQVLSDVFLPVDVQRLEITVGTLLAALAAGVVMPLLAGITPALQAAAEDPADTLRRIPPARGTAYRGLQVAGILGLVGLAALCVALKQQLPARLGTYGSLVLFALAMLLATPLLTALIGRLLQAALRRLPGITCRLAVDNLVRAPGRTGVVIGALAAGVALLVQTGGLIRSNEQAVRGWIDQSVAGDVWVTSGGPLTASGQTLPMAEAVGRRLQQACPELQIVPMRFRYLDWHQAGHAARVLLMALDAPGYYAVNKDRRPPLPDLELYRRLAEPGTALVSENFAVLHGVNVGETLTLPGSDGPVALRVIGRVTDYSCNRGTVLVDRSRYGRAFGADLVDVFDVYVPGGDPEVIRQQLQASPLAAEQALCVVTRGELRGHILGMVDRLYGLAYTQEAVVALVAVLGMVMALLISVLQRRRELGLLRALGATRAQVVRSVVAEAVLLAILGTALGLLTGLPLEWYTVRVLLLEESGFRCPLLFPGAIAAAVSCLALAGALVAGLGPALHAARLGIPEAVACE